MTCWEAQRGTATCPNLRSWATNRSPACSDPRVCAFLLSAPQVAESLQRAQPILPRATWGQACADPSQGPAHSLSWPWESPLFPAAFLELWRTHQGDMDFYTVCGFLESPCFVANIHDEGQVTKGAKPGRIVRTSTWTVESRLTTGVHHLPCL